MPHLIDADALKRYGKRGGLVHWKDIEETPTIEPPTTEWLGNHTPFRCKRCGHYSDSRTPYCAYCGKKAINVANP